MIERSVIFKSFETFFKSKELYLQGLGSIARWVILEDCQDIDEVGEITTLVSQNVLMILEHKEKFFDN